MRVGLILRETGSKRPCKWGSAVGIYKLDEAEAKNLFELIQKRRKRSSTIFCSQFREEDWYRQLCRSGESTVADAIMDRISYDSYKIDIESIDPSKDLSMREVYGLNPAEVR